MSKAGKKNDGLGGKGQMKDRFDLIPDNVELLLAQVLTHGAKKYDANNWQKVEGWRYKGAIRRHLSQHYLGEDNDKDSGLPHLAHALCNVAFLLWKHLQGQATGRELENTKKALSGRTLAGPYLKELAERKRSK